jgi:hypothetical protein
MRKMIQDTAGGAGGAMGAAALNTHSYADRKENDVEGGGIPFLGDGVGNVSQSAAEALKHWGT